LGSADSLARRAQRCIDEGRLDTAAAIASALAASGADGVEQALLEARIAMAVGRPDQAMTCLGGYCQTTPYPGSHSMAREWFARAALCAGRSVEAFVSRLHLEPDVGAMSEIVMSLVDADDGAGLGSCVAHVARRGDPELWTLLAESAAAALGDAMGIDTDLVANLLGMGSEIESLLDTIESVVTDMESSMPAPAERSMAAELVSLASDALSMLESAHSLHLAVSGRSVDEGNDISETISLLLGVADPPPRCNHDSHSCEWTWTFRERPSEDALGRARLAALMCGASWNALWRNGEYVVSVSGSALQPLASGSAGASASASSWAPASGPDASEIERMLKSLPSQEAAELLIRAIRSARVHHARGLLDEACRALSEMAGALGAEVGVVSEPALALDGVRRAVAKIRAEIERWSRYATEASCMSRDSNADAHAGAQVGAHIGGDANANAEDQPSVADADEWSLPDELDCTPEAYQALRTAHLLIAGLSRNESLPPEQAELPAFLIQKAVQMEAERKLGEALAVHRLKPRALAATRDRGKRRRELDPDFVRDAVSRAPQGINPDRVRGGLERLFARVLDGSSRPLSGDLFLAGLALAYLDPLGDAERSAALGSAFLAMDEAAVAKAASDMPERRDLRRLEQAGIEAIRALSLFGGREGR
jgi:hypothetical protein